MPKRPYLAVSELASLKTCEQRIVLKEQHGKRMTAEQGKAARLGEKEHRHQDMASRYHTQSRAWWKALRAGVLVGAPLTLLGLFGHAVLSRSTQAAPESLVHEIAQYLIAPGVWAVDAGASWAGVDQFVLMVAAFTIAQAAAYTLFAYTLHTAAWWWRPRRTPARNATPQGRHST